MYHCGCCHKGRLCQSRRRFPPARAGAANSAPKETTRVSHGGVKVGIGVAVSSGRADPLLAVGLAVRTLVV